MAAKDIKRQDVIHGMAVQLTYVLQSIIGCLSLLFPRFW